jgi:hypothetical protein
MRAWISKAKLLPLQAKMWLAKGNRTKYVKNTDVKKVDGIWIPTTMTVRTMKDETKLESTTIMQFNTIKMNQAEVSDGDFTQTRLEKGI